MVGATRKSRGEDEGMARIAGVLMVLVALWCGIGRADDSIFLPAPDPAPLLAAIAAETPTFTPPPGVTGISVPHHLLAADLIARGFWAASAGHYTRIIVISPDHFHKVRGAFGTVRGDLATVLGPVPSDSAGVEALATRHDLVAVLPSIAHEHGVMALAPFMAHFFPGAHVIPILASVNATPDDWRGMVELLKPLLTPDTLVVQSTDYSHYRPLAEAVARDQESIATIDAADPDGVLPLLQPSHMDSKAAQYIQMALQASLGVHPVVLANRNSVEYGGSASATTSYVVTAWLRDAAAGTVFDYPDQARTIVAGDTLLGRYLLPALRSPAPWRTIRDTVLAATSGAPLVVNLEGVLLDGPVTGVDFNTHVMVMGDAAPVLTALNVKAAGLANNHANDLGQEGRRETARLLRSLGIQPIEHGMIADLGAFRVLALDFVNGRFVGDAIARPSDLDLVCHLTAAPPLVAFVHWGTEYTSQPGDTERDIAGRLAACGVSVIVGAHSHQASGGVEMINGGAAQMVYSLGNFLFDQSAPRGSGMLVELRVFRQGTVAVRPIAIPNLFDLTR
jgi:poly-gamma-glutamate synthesis protein (capsule biosynthesis protein)